MIRSSDFYDCLQPRCFFVCPFIYMSLKSYIDQPSIDPSVHQTNHSTNQSTIYLSINPIEWLLWRPYLNAKEWFLKWMFKKWRIFSPKCCLFFPSKERIFGFKLSRNRSRQFHKPDFFVWKTDYKRTMQHLFIYKLIVHNCIILCRRMYATMFIICLHKYLYLQFKSNSRFKNNITGHAYRTLSESQQMRSLMPVYIM